MLQLATEKIQNLCNRNRWSGLLQLGSVRFRSFFQSSELDLWTLLVKGGLDISGSEGLYICICDDAEKIWFVDSHASVPQ